MTISAHARSVGALETAANDYASIFDATAGTYQPASIVKVQCVSNGLVAKINGDATRLIVITAGTIDYIRSVAPGGIKKIEVKNLTTDQHATLYWSDAVCV